MSKRRNILRSSRIFFKEKEYTQKYLGFTSRQDIHSEIATHLLKMGNILRSRVTLFKDKKYVEKVPEMSYKTRNILKRGWAFHKDKTFTCK